MNLIFEFCDIISFVQLCSTNKRLYSLYHNSSDQWNRYESMIPQSSRWCYDINDDVKLTTTKHPQHTATTINSTTTTRTKMRVIRYVHASRFASKLQPFVPYHPAAAATASSSNATDRCSHDNNNLPMMTDCFNERMYSNYGYFVRLFPLQQCITDFPSITLKSTNEKFTKVAPSSLINHQKTHDDDDDCILWQGFLNVNKVTKWPRHSGKTIEIQTQSQFDFLNDIPNLISEHTRLRRWSPLTNLANNVGIIVIAVQTQQQQQKMMTTTTEDYRMSLVYASIQTAPTCMVFSKLNFELSNMYDHHHHQQQQHASGIRSSSSSLPPPPPPPVEFAPRSKSSGFVGTKNTMTMMRRVSIIANNNITATTIRSGSINQKTSLTFNIDEGYANRIGFIGNPYIGGGLHHKNK